MVLEQAARTASEVGLPGSLTGSPVPIRAIRRRSISGWNATESCRCPAVVTRSGGRHRRSASRWIFVLRPPRERPKPSRSGCLPLVGGEFLSIDPAPGATRRRHLLLQRDGQPLHRDVFRRFISRPRGVPMGADHGHVPTDRTLRALLRIAPRAQPVQDRFPRSSFPPPRDPTRRRTPSPGRGRRR